jgi:hypothetical protein
MSERPLPKPQTQTMYPTTLLIGIFDWLGDMPAPQVAESERAAAIAKLTADIVRRFEVEPEIATRFADLHVQGVLAAPARPRKVV